MSKIICPLCGEPADAKLDEFEVAEVHYVHNIKYGNRTYPKKCMVLNSSVERRAAWQKQTAKATRYTEKFLARPVGIEPTSTGLEAVILPLDEGR